MKSITHFWGYFTKLINSWGHKKDWNETWKIQITHPLHEKDLDPRIWSEIGDKKGSFQFLPSDHSKVCSCPSFPTTSNLTLLQKPIAIGSVVRIQVPFLLPDFSSGCFLTWLFVLSLPLFHVLSKGEHSQPLRYIIHFSQIVVA